MRRKLMKDWYSDTEYVDIFAMYIGRYKQSSNLCDEWPENRA